MIVDINNVSIVNLTNQEIKVYPYEDVDIPTPVKQADRKRFLDRCITIKASGHSRSEVNRDTETLRVGFIGSKKVIPISYTNIGATSGIPEEKDNVIYVVSQMVYNSLHHIRKDVYMIDKPIRDENGAVIACRSFSRCVYTDHIKPLNETIQVLNNLLLATTDTVLQRVILQQIVNLTNYIKK